MFKKLVIILSRKCNLRCNYCYLRKLKYPKDIIKWDIIKHSIDVFFKYWANSKGQSMIFFFGGEPFLHFDLIKKSAEYCNKYYKGKDIIFSVTTNGTLFTEDRINFLYKNNFEINLSLDGAQLAQDYSRPFLNSNKSSFKAIMKYLPYLVGYPRFKVNMVISPETVKYADKNFHFLVKNNVKNIKIMTDILYFSDKVWWDKGSLDVLRKQCFKIIDSYFIFKRNHYNINLANITTPDRDEVEKETCLTNFKVNLAVVPNGNIYICCMCFQGMDSKEEDKFLLGNVYDKSLVARLENFSYHCGELENKKIFNEKIKKIAKDKVSICALILSDFKSKQKLGIERYLSVYKSIQKIYREEMYNYYKDKAIL